MPQNFPTSPYDETEDDYATRMEGALANASSQSADGQGMAQTPMQFPQGAVNSRPVINQQQTANTALKNARQTSLGRAGGQGYGKAILGGLGQGMQAGGAAGALGGALRGALQERVAQKRAANSQAAPQPDMVAPSPPPGMSAPAQSGLGALGQMGQLGNAISTIALLRNFI